MGWQEKAQGTRIETVDEISITSTGSNIFVNFCHSLVVIFS